MERRLKSLEKEKRELLSHSRGLPETSKMKSVANIFNK